MYKHPKHPIKYNGEEFSSVSAAWEASKFRKVSQLKNLNKKNAYILLELLRRKFRDDEDLKKALTDTNDAKFVYKGNKKTKMPSIKHKLGFEKMLELVRTEIVDEEREHADRESEVAEREREHRELESILHLFPDDDDESEVSYSSGTGSDFDGRH